jgi:hypothetical protein
VLFVSVFICLSTSVTLCKTATFCCHIITAINYVVPFYYLPTVWSSVNMSLLSKNKIAYNTSKTITACQPIKKLPAFSGIGKFTTAFTAARQMSLTKATLYTHAVRLFTFFISSFLLLFYSHFHKSNNFIFAMIHVTLFIVIIHQTVSQVQILIIFLLFPFHKACGLIGLVNVCVCVCVCVWYIQLCLLVVCLFSWRYNPLWLCFPQPGSGL